MIDSATFKNYLALGDVTATFERFTVIVGPNACGKTTLLGGIQRMGEVAAGERGPIDSDDQTATSKESPLVTLKRGTVQMFSREIDSPLRVGHTHVAQGDATDSELYAVVSDLAATEFLALEPNSLRGASEHLSTRQRFDRSGRGLGAMLADITLDDPKLREQIEDGLRRIVPNVKRLSVRRSHDSVTRYEPWVTFLDVGEVPPAHLSEGTLLALGLMTALVAANRPRHVLFDDIEKGLHPTAQAHLVEIFREFLAEDAGLQIICTSHSPYLLHNFAIDEVGVMRLGPDGLARYQRLRDHPEVDKWKDALSAGELWSSVGEDWIAESEHVG